LGKTAADGDGTDSSPDPTRRPDEAPEPFVPTAGESPAETSPTRRADDPEDLDRDLAHRLYATEIALGWQHWKQGDVESLRQLLARQATRFQRGTTRDLRGFEWHYLHRLAHAEERVLPGDFPMVREIVSLGVAGDLLTLHRIATNTQPPEIRRWNLAEEEDSRPLDSNLGIDLDSVGCLAASADGQFLALASGKEVRVIQLLTSATLEIPTGHEDFVFCLAFSPDGERLASGSLDGKVRIWDRPTGTLVAEMDGGRQSDDNPLGILSVAWSADGTRLVTGSGDDRAPVWFQRLHGELKLWDAQTAEAICTFQNVPSQVNCVAFAGDRWVLSGGFGGELLVWDVGTGGLVRRLGTQTGPIRSLAVIADPWRVAAACHDGTARVWQIETGEELAVTRGHRGAVSRVVWDAARGRLVTGGWDGTLRVWDVREPVERSNLGVHPWTILQTHHPVDGQSVITVDYHSARVFDSHTRRPLRTIHSGHWNVSSALTPDNRQLLLGGFSGPDGSGTGFVSLWSLETGERLAGFDPGAGRGIRVSVSRDGRWLAALGFSATRERDRLTLWELTPSGPGKRLGRWTVSASPVFTPDSRSLVFAQPEGLARYSLVDQQLQKPLPEGSRQFTQLAVAPDSQRLAATDEAGDLTLWNLSDGQVVQRGPVHAGPVGRLLFSPKGDTLITANRETTRLWTVAPFGLRAEIPRPACEMLVTPDNRTLITAWQTLDFWQLETGLPMLQLDDYQMEIPNCLSVSPDGNLLSEGGGSRDENEGVYLWRATPVSAPR
jgi:WD40 repeat protein